MGKKRAGRKKKTKKKKPALVTLQVPKDAFIRDSGLIQSDGHNLDECRLPGTEALPQEEEE